MRKGVFLLCLAICILFTLSSVCASDANDTMVASEDANQIELSSNDVTLDDNLKTSEENNTLTQANDDETVSAETDSQILSDDEGTYEDLIDDFNNGYFGSVVLSHKYYKIDEGNTIVLNFACNLDGNGATIDMNGKNFAIFSITGDTAIIKNLIFKNLNGNGAGGVIIINGGMGLIANCTFENNHDSSGVGAILVARTNHATITNCTFVNNVGNESGAIYFRENCDNCKVENCTFIDNSASSGKNAIGGNIGSFSLNDNWWGSNNPNWQDLIDAHEPERYAVLICSINTTTITAGSKAKLNYAFYRNGTADRLSLPARQIKLSTTGGDLDKTSGDLINEFSTEFSSDTPGYYEITATVDNEIIKIPVYVVNKIIYVNSSVDSSGDGKTNETLFKTLKEALDVAEDYDTIMIAAGTYTGSNNVDLTIEKNNLIFNKYGDGDAIFDAQGDCRIWTVNTSSSSVININGLTFKNGNAKSGNYGGAIYFKNNVTDSNINAAFINNTAMNGSAIYYSDKVTDSTLSGTYINNKETSVIYLEGESENSVIHDAVFINNYNNNNIYVKSGIINVTNCWFGNNATNYNEKPDIGIDLNDWLFLNATAEPGEIKLGQSSTIAFKLYNKNSPAVEYDASKMNIVLDLNQTLGELDKTTVSLGEKISYTAKESGNASVTGKFETASYTVSLKNKPKTPVDIILENETIDLEVGDEVSAGATLNPPVGNLTYTSSNESVVIVKNGVIKAVGEGSANVTVSFNGTDEYASAERNITVCVLSEAEWYYMADGRINNLDGASGLILPFGVYTCVVLDSNGQPLSKGLNVNIKLNDDYILNATVGEDGMFDLDVNGIKTGKYTATFSSNGYTHAVATFFIVKKQTDITLENSTMALKVNDIVSSGATLNPADAGDLTYTSSNSSVAIVENGKIKAIAIGTAVITVSFSGNANYYATKNKTIEVTVTLNDASVYAEGMTLNVGENSAIGYATNPAGLNVTFVVDDSGVYSVDSNGVVTALREGTGHILVKVGGDGVYAENSTVVAVTVSKMPTEIASAAITTVYNVNKNIIITLKDAKGNAISGVELTVNLNGAKTYKTDKNGQIKINVAKLVPKAYTAKISFAGNNNYKASSATVKVTVKKAKSKIVAKKKTFKKAKKIKKYAIILKSGKTPIKKVWVTLKIKGKKILKAKTNNKGKATFNIKKLTKKGKYLAVIKFKGNKYYKAKSAKSKIIVK